MAETPPLAPVEQAVIKTLTQVPIRVLAMKLQAPDLLDHIRRPRVLETLGRHTPIKLLMAAAGYGKSSIMADWCKHQEQLGVPVAWLTLDPKENDPHRFLLYLMSAVNSVLPSVGITILKTLETKPNPIFAFEQWLTELSQLKPSVTDDKGRAVILALDDCHHIHNDVVLDMLQHLVCYLPPNTQLICSSRRDWPNPYIDMRVKQRIQVMCETELAFDWQETQTWLEQMVRSRVSQSQVDSVFDLTRGWLMGLQLIHQSVHSCDLTLLKKDEHIIYEYFTDLLKEHLTQNDIRRFKQVATFGKASAPLIHAVFGDTNLELDLDALCRQHYLLFRDEEQPSWYRLHPMMQQFFELRLDREKQRKNLIKASDWLVTQEEPIFAVELALRSKDKNRAASLVQITAESILEDQDIAQLLSWKEQLPIEIVSASPRLIVIFSWALAFAQQADEAERLMAKIDQFLPLGSSSKNDEVSGQLFAIRAYLARIRGNIDNSVQLCNQALAKLPDEKYVARAVTYYNLANALMTQDNLTKAREYNRLSFETARAAGSVHLEMLALHEHARIEQIKGNLRLSRKIVEEGLHLADQLTNAGHAAAYGRLLLYRGYLAWLADNCTEAEEDIHQGMRISESCYDAYIILGYVLLSNIERQKGNTEKAFDYLVQGEAKLQRWRVPSVVFQPWLITMRANLLIDEGKTTGAIASLDLLYQQSKNTPYILAPEHYPHLRGLIDVFYVRAKALIGEHKEALKILEAKANFSDETEQGFRQIFIFLMRALLRFQLGQEENAIKDFRIAVAKAEKSNCLYPFIEYSASMAPLYQILPPHVAQTPFVERVLSSINIDMDHARNSAFIQAKSIISHRELSVLQLIAQGLSNQDIADSLYISLHTVKTHARRINSKLEVKSRTQAIIKAREIGLI